MEENKGKDEVVMIIPASTELESGSVSNNAKLGSSPNSSLRLTLSPNFQRTKTPKHPFTYSFRSSFSKTTSSFVGSRYSVKELHETTRAENKFKNKSFLGFTWWVFICLAGVLIASLTVYKLQSTLLWGLKLWKWTVFVSSILCGGLISNWVIKILVFLIERKHLYKIKVLFMVYGMRKSVQAFVWLGMIVLTWALLINSGVKRSRKTKKFLNYMTRALGGLIVGAAIWMVKTFLIQLVAFSFQCTRFFDRIYESIFHQYVVWILSCTCPLMVGEQEKVIDVELLDRIRQGMISTRMMKRLIDMITESGLSTMADVDDGEQKLEITNEEEAEAAARKIFINVSKLEEISRKIYMEDLLRYMRIDEAEAAFTMIVGEEETNCINKFSLKDWLVSRPKDWLIYVYKERKALTHSLHHSRIAVEKLNNLASGIIIVIDIIVWCLIMGFFTTQVLFLVLSQVVLAAFMFGNCAKEVFEAIIFVFVTHPFDVGDRCVIDGEEMFVEEINIINTIFLQQEYERKFYPNAALATKTISNFYRNPAMDDSIEFNIPLSTPIEIIDALSTKIKEYLERNPQYWRPNHNVVVKEIDENANKLKMVLYMSHNINFLYYGNKSSRRSELILELKKILECLSIICHLPPQEVHVMQLGHWQ